CKYFVATSTYKSGTDAAQDEPGVTHKGEPMNTEMKVRTGKRMHRMLIAELSGAGCFRPAAARTAAYGAFILASYAAAYAALLTGPGVAVRALAIFVLAFISVHAGFIAHEAGHGAITRDRRVA